MSDFFQKAAQARNSMQTQAGAEHCDCHCHCEHEHAAEAQAEGVSESSPQMRADIEEFLALDERQRAMEAAQGSEIAMAQALAITRIINERLTSQNCLCPGERESVSYRLAEILTYAKELYTSVLPRLLGQKLMQEAADNASEGEAPEVEELPLFEELAGTRMSFMHMKDLIEDFDEAFMEAMAGQRRADGNEETLPGPEALED